MTLEGHNVYQQILSNMEMVSDGVWYVVWHLTSIVNSLHVF